MKKQIILFLLLATTTFLHSQPPSALLDLESTEKGILVPRMTSAQRSGIATPATGLLVYDTNSNSFWYFNGSVWQNLVGGGGGTPTSYIQDADGNTKVQTEANLNEDIIRFSVGGLANVAILKNAHNVPRLELPAFYNTVVGEQAGVNIAPGANSAGSGNSYFGFQSGLNTSTGSNNTAIGFNSLVGNTIGHSNTAVGVGGLFSNTEGIYNTSVGRNAMYFNTTGSQNTALGVDALNKSTTGSNNTAVGMSTLLNNTTGSGNTGIGLNALYSNTTANYNTAVGWDCLVSNTTGENNSGLGWATLVNNTSGHSNSALGVGALYSNTTGYNNSSFGRNALYFNTTGYQNTAIGLDALNKSTAGLNNTAIGFGAGFNNLSGSGNVFLGMQAGFNETGSNKLYIENSPADNNNALIYGDFAADKVRINSKLGIGKDAVTNALEVNGSYTSKNLAGSWAANSDRRLKTNILYLQDQSEMTLQKVLQMKPCTFEWNDDKTGLDRPKGMFYGFIAQDLQQVWPDKVWKDELGYLQTPYGDYDPMFVESFRALTKRTDDLQQENTALKSELSALQNDIDFLKSQLKTLLENSGK